MVEILNYDKISRFHMLVKFFKVYIARYSNDNLNRTLYCVLANIQYNNWVLY